MEGVTTVREFQAEDIPGVLEIQASCREISQWSAGDYAAVALGQMHGWIAETHAKVTGFLIAREIVSEIEILNLAVAPHRRSQGVGSALLNKVIEWADTSNKERAFLEVRVSNSGAIRFYEAHGFQFSGSRRKYYSDPIEDALVMERTIRGAVGS
jgi:[ribosomal protein S18]-alanine N-acetyltransferase